eukprot:TRINITY_DN38614_c0_g1_i1.p1 TRINITY_DN38614_c0_g1~~TRINITY_DN38614_c0_g1_i1.p1  ORF type:complete len:437 (+),score=64.31 TRINITY_DN38614_c0_g1_i1:50-1312(+)
MSRFYPVKPRPMEHPDAWNQDETMLPPPYKGEMRGIAAEGIFVGDKLYDGVQRSVLLSAVHGDGLGELPEGGQPGWVVDWETVARGQRLWLKYMGPQFMTLPGGLLIGFCIRRFAEVLLASGYADSPEVAHQRYEQTGFHMQDWYRYPLDDPSSLARKSVKKVRAMHAYARQRAMDQGIIQDPSEGILLSQYDLSETMLGFTAVSFELLYLAGIKLTDDELSDMLSVFRVIGHYIGIEERFCICKSVEENVNFFADYNTWSRCRVAHPSKAGIRLQEVVTHGFGRHLPTGRQYWNAFMELMYDELNKRFGSGFKPATPPALPGVTPTIRLAMAVSIALTTITQPRSYVLTSQLIKQHDLYYSGDKAAWKAATKRVERVSLIMDNYVWRAVSLLYRFIWEGYLIAAVALYTSYCVATRYYH